MRTIHKYVLEFVEAQTIRIPRRCKPLSAQMQNGKLCLWVEVDTDEPAPPVNVYIVGTGHELPTFAMNYVDTVQVGVFVWHVYVGQL